MVDENEKPQAPLKKGIKKNGPKIRLWVAIALAVVIFILVIQNTQAVTVSVLFWNLQISLVILIPFVFLVGLVIGYVVRRRQS